ncbi:WD repeat-containing protein 60 isoform X2 [Belonocnema kinseyi]|uniref:WD repeat-containing protein 60 isoform X2 n=1 Tax=Belonocnema kinseyi TaxID=2817044 RepID=UPI00143DB05F|nr:WD repeat-containing protein 60 isoform X2 [Belonocnema kinseyi]
MSNRGAIKKTFESKTGPIPHSQVKTKTHRSQDTLERTSKAEVEKEKERRRVDQNAGRDSKSKSAQNPVNHSSTKSTTRNSSTLSHSKSTLKNGAFPTSKAPLYNSTKTSTSSRATSSRTKSEIENQLSKNTRPTERSKSKEVKAKNVEKRGSSTIYMPKSNASKLSSLTTKQSVESNTSEMRKYTDKNDMLKERQEQKRQSSRERRKSRTLSPSEVRVLHTAVGPRKQVEKQSGEIEDAAKADSDEDYDYEDDFESYESDFEECTESDASPISEETEESRNSPVLEPIEMKTMEKRRIVSSYEIRKPEEERMLDSGHYELAEARRRAAKIESMSVESVPISRPKTPPLPELIQPVNQSFREEKQSENKSLPLSMDEGFEDGRSGDFAKSPPLSQFSESSKLFKPIRKRKESKKLSRGRELMTMIKLDTVEWSLYESAPIAYEEFIRNYGKINTQQMSTQTNEDNLDIDIQTEAIESSNKWTQFPITCRKNLKSNEDIRMFKKEQIGVGSEEDESSSSLLPVYDVVQLNDFLERAGKVMLCLLEERRSGGNILQKNIHEMPFSAGFIKLSVDTLTFLSGRSVTFIVYSEVLNKVLLTVHAQGDEDIETTKKEDYITDCCIGCIWNISEPSRPTKVIYSQSPITSCCFHPTSYNLVFAGLQDGSINLWDLKEDEMWHQRVTDKDNEMDWVLRSPTYTTAENFELGHKSEVVALRVLSKIDNDYLDRVSNKFLPIQICSLDEEGSLIIWSVLHTMTKNIQDIGLSHWGDVKLVKSQEVPLFLQKSETENNLRGFFDMNIDSVDNNDIYLSTNTNNILHASCIGRKTNPFSYKADELDWCGNATCIERCPFKHSFFLVGCEDGTVRLHSLNVEKSLLQLKDDHCISAVKTIQWSKSKPFTLFVLDDHSQIHVWDLTNSDIFPTYTISTKKWERVKSLRLSPCNSIRDMVNQYLAIGTETGSVEVHKLKKDFYYSQQEEFLEEMNMFLRYVAVL